jgi:hypothetical protein
MNCIYLLKSHAQVLRETIHDLISMREKGTEVITVWRIIPDLTS